MKCQKKAVVHWIPLEKTGKPKALSSDAPYYPHIVSEEDLEKRHWSIALFSTGKNEKNESLICFSMLADGPEAQTFWESLETNTRFTLLEGGTPVAYGSIV